MEAGTATLAAIECDDEYTITIRSFELGYMMGRFNRRFTVKAVAEEFSLSPSGAYRLLSRASGSRKVMLVEDGGQWHVPPDIDAADWPY